MLLRVTPPHQKKTQRMLVEKNENGSEVAGFFKDERDG